MSLYAISLVSWTGTSGDEQPTLSSDGSNVASGAGGADSLYGSLFWADTLRGGDGNDLLSGGAVLSQWLYDSSLVMPGMGYDLAGALDAIYAIVDGITGGTVAHEDITAQVSGVGGYDKLYGGTGDDTYLVNSPFTKTWEYVGEGVDTVISLVDWTLQANFENLTLDGTALSGTGNNAGNVITGNASNNTLSGIGGADTLIGGEGNDRLDGGNGADRLEGGAGNDVYVVGSGSDVVVELTGAGADTVEASVNWTLGNYLESLLLTGAAINGTGNTLGNAITGNALGNALYGGGGNDTLQGGDGDDRLYGSSGSDSLVGEAGNDTLYGGGSIDTLAGGSGDDTYVVESSGDVVTENDTLAAEIDTIEAGISWTLGANLENLVLTGTATNGNGNALDNRLTGNGLANSLLGLGGKDSLEGGDGDDTLNGGGGFDTLTGAAGVDHFVFENTDGGDQVTDFTSGTDRFVLKDQVFSIGDADDVIDFALTRAAPGNFNGSNELVIFTANISGDITSSSAALVIGSASAPLAADVDMLFVVDNGIDTAVFLFNSAAADAVVSASELTKIATLVGTASSVATDYLFI